jgi:hypothetical protein
VTTKKTLENTVKSEDSLERGLIMINRCIIRLIPYEYVLSFLVMTNELVFFVLVMKVEF